jgi:hypothetical protein
MAQLRERKEHFVVLITLLLLLSCLWSLLTTVKDWEKMVPPRFLHPSTLEDVPLEQLSVSTFRCDSTEHD